MSEQLWVEPVGNLIVARIRGLPTEELLQECQRRVVQIAHDRAGAKVHRVLYDTLEMESPSVDVPWEQRRAASACDCSTEYAVGVSGAVGIR